MLGVLIAAVATAFPACRPPADDQGPSADVCVNPPRSVRQTFDCLRLWHARCAYAAMRPYLDPNAREDLVDLLVAMDELLAANAGTQAAIRQACPGLDPSPYDLSYLQHYMAFFSKDVEYVRERNMGDEVVVVVQIGGRMPLEELQFRRLKPKKGPSWWVYVPGGQVPQLVPLIRQVAGALSQITLVLSTSKNVTPEEVRREFEIRIRQRILKKAGLAGRRETAPQQE